jgi:hypothetical protein
MAGIGLRGLLVLSLNLEKEAFEYGKSIYGIYEHFYKKDLLNNYKTACIDSCLNINSLDTKNLTQVEKNCVKECVIHTTRFTHVYKAMMFLREFSKDKGSFDTQI